MPVSMPKFRKDTEDLRRLAKEKPFPVVPIPPSGQPEGGGKPAGRGFFPKEPVQNELLALCELIHTDGPLKFDDGTAAIPYGILLQVYTVVNDKVMNVLMRARKYGLIYFEGEMLYTGRDDAKPIILIKPIDTIREELKKLSGYQVEVNPGAYTHVSTTSVVPPPLSQLP